MPCRSSWKDNPSNLGYADSATTTKIYAHAIQSAAAASAQMMDDLLNPMAGKRRP